MEIKLEKVLQAALNRLALKKITPEQNLQSLILDIQHLLDPEITAGRKLSEGRKNDK